MTDTRTNNERDNSALEAVYKQSIQGSYKDMQLATYALKKSERLVAALHEVLHVSHGQDETVDLITKTAVGLITDASQSGRSRTARESFGERLVTLTALLSVAARLGRASENNVQVLVEELQDLSAFLHSFGWFRGHSFLNPHELTVDAPRALFVDELPRKRTETYNGHKTDEPERAPVASETRSPYAQEKTVVQRTTVDKGHYGDRMQQAQKDRRTAILSVVQQRDRITIKDVAQVIKDVSEKTIQRELLALVQQGVLKKEGERRWSTYSFATK